MESFPALSAIVVIPDSFETVRRTLSTLAAQTAVAELEVVFVVPQPQLEIPAAALSRFHSTQVVVDPFHSIAQAKAAGVRRARAPVVVLTEDHSFPAPNWAERLLAAHQGAHAAVSPALHNGNPESIVSWADFFIAYGKWAEPITSRMMPFLPGHNSSYKRAALLQFEPRLGDLLDQEILLHWALVAQGDTLWLEGSTYTAHLNFSTWQRWFDAQLYSGRKFAARRAAAWSPWKRIAFVLASPLIPVIRFIRVQPDIRRARLPFSFWFRLNATIFIGLVIDGLGQALGYGFGEGQTTQADLNYEFHRVPLPGALSNTIR